MVGKSNSKKPMEYCEVCKEWVLNIKKHHKKRHEGKDNLELRDLK